MSPANELTAAIADEALAELDSLWPLFIDTDDRRDEINARLASLEALRQIVGGDDQRS